MSRTVPKKMQKRVPGMPHGDQAILEPGVTRVRWLSGGLSILPLNHKVIFWYAYLEPIFIRLERSIKTEIC